MQESLSRGSQCIICDYGPSGVVRLAQLSLTVAKVLAVPDLASLERGATKHLDRLRGSWLHRPLSKETYYSVKRDLL